MKTDKKDYNVVINNVLVMSVEHHDLEED